MNAHIARAREESTQAGSGGNFGGNINQSFGRNRIVQGFDTHHVVPAAAFWVGQFPGGQSAFNPDLPSGEAMPRCRMLERAPSPVAAPDANTRRCSDAKERA